MTEIEDAPGARAFIGVGISKTRGTDRGARQAAPPQDDADQRQADFERLVMVLHEHGLPVWIGFEATSNYHRTL